MSRARDINEYLDGRMTPERRAAFEARLAAEPELAAEVDETRRVLALLAALPVEHAPATLTARVMSEVRAQPVSRRRWWALGRLTALPRPRTLAWAAAAAMLLAVSVFMRPGQDDRIAHLSPVDEAFVTQCLTDYHAETIRVSPSGEIIYGGLGTGF